MKKIYLINRVASLAAFSSLLLAGLLSCQDELSPIGESIYKGDVIINVDSTSLNFESHTVDAVNIDARSVTNLLGHINVPEYGELSASYVTQLLSAAELAIPDSIGVDRVDSLKLALVAPRALVIGDSLAPQQFKAFVLDRQLPSDIKSNFNPDGYYDPSKPVATRNYTLSGLSLTDSAFRKSTTLTFSTPLPRKWGVDLFNAYRENPENFAWPASFNKFFPGLYLKPSFGKGAMANILATRLILYYHHFITRTITVDDEPVKKQVTISQISIIVNSLFK